MIETLHTCSEHNVRCEDASLHLLTIYRGALSILQVGIVKTSDRKMTIECLLIAADIDL